MSTQKHDLLPIPNNPDAERMVIGLLLADGAQLGEIASRVKPEQFFTPIYRKLFATALRLDDESKSVDALMLSEALAGDGDLKSAGGLAFLASLSDGITTRTNVGDYCRQIVAAAQRRIIQAITERAQIDAGNPSILVHEILERTEAELISIREGDANAARVALHISDIAKEVAPVLDRVTSGQGMMLGTPTGFPDLDRLTSGLMIGEFLILGARPSVGKTALALELVLRQARAGNGTVVFSLEMTRISVFLRLACREAGVPYKQVVSGHLNREGTRKLCAAIIRLGTFPIWIDDRSGISSKELRWSLRSVTRRQAIKLCVVDYLQLLHAKAENRTQEVTQISLDLKAAAKELGHTTGGTLLALAQLNRAGANERPQLFHLRESGQLEQDADAVFLLSDEEQKDRRGPDPYVKILDIAKQRNGPIDSMKLVYLPLVMGFEQATKQWDQEPVPEQEGGNTGGMR